MNLLKSVAIIFCVTLLFSCNKKTKEVATTTTTEVKSSPTATTEGPRRGGERGGRQRDPEARQKRMEALYTELNFSDAQKQKFEEISNKYQEKRRAIFQNGRGGDREAMRAQVEKMREEQSAELKKIMTEEQFEKYSKIMEEQRKNNRGGRGGRGGRERN